MKRSTIYIYEFIYKKDINFVYNNIKKDETSCIYKEKGMLRIKCL